MDFIETVTLTGQRQYVLAAIHHTAGVTHLWYHRYLEITARDVQQPHRRHASEGIDGEAYRRPPAATLGRDHTDDTTSRSAGRWSGNHGGGAA